MSKQKLILAWVENTGFELTGRYLDRYLTCSETKAIPEAKAARFGDDTPAMRTRIEQHIAGENCGGKLWIGFFSLPDTKDVMEIARKKALTMVPKQN